METTSEINSSVYFRRLSLPIVAIATAHGGPVGVLRISGKNLSFLETMCGSLPAAGTFRYSPIRLRDGLVVDRAVVLFFASPASFTGENVVEIQCHGIASILESVEAECQKLGAEAALPGEFSFRAVLNGKMRLEEAESLQTAYANESLSAHWAAELVGVRKLGTEGVESRLKECLNELAAARGRVEAAIDFPESESEQSDDLATSLSLIGKAQARLLALRTSFEIFSTFAATPLVALVGRPNSGKSTLFNILCGGERVLVSDVAGTTRDAIESRIILGRGRKVRLVDTAGLRQNGEGDDLELAGVRLGLDIAKNAALLVWVVDVTDSDLGPVQKIIESLGRPTVRVLSHGDLVRPSEAFDFLKQKGRVGEHTLRAIEDALTHGDTPAPEIIISERQFEVLRLAQKELCMAEDSLVELRPIELACEHVRAAETLLLRALGRGPNEQYIDEIFSQFCLGK